MTWTATTVDGVIVVTNDDRRLEAITNEPHATNIAHVLARALQALDDAHGDPGGVNIEADIRTRR
jgi:hypothetical protein